MNTTRSNKGITNSAKNAMSTAWNSTRSGFNKVGRSYSGLSGGQKAILIIIILIVVSLIIYWAYQAYQTSAHGDAANPILIGAPVNAFNADLAKKTFDVPDTKSGMQFSYSMWLYIADWDYKYGQMKQILVKGDPTTDLVAPGLWFYERTNSLHARISTFADVNEGCDISNIPLQKWVHIVYVLNNRTTDIYVDGKLERSCVLKGVPRLNNRPVKVCGMDAGQTEPGFNGQIAKLQFYSTALMPEDVYTIYTQGPFLSSSYKVSLGGSDGVNVTKQSGMSG